MQFSKLLSLVSQTVPGLVVTVTKLLRLTVSWPVACVVNMEILIADVDSIVADVAVKVSWAALAIAGKMPTMEALVRTPVHRMHMPALVVTSPGAHSSV